MPTATDFKDYYAILGVSKTATPEEIKRDYRKLARKYHPDLNPGDKDAEAKFKDLNEANEVLSDPERRQKYDQFGQYWNQGGQSGSPQPGRASSVSTEDFDQYGDFDSFINDLLGGMRGRSRLGLVALMILVTDFVLKLPHRIPKPRSRLHFPKRFTVSRSGCNSTTKKSMSAFPQAQNQAVEFGSRVKVVLVRSLNSVAIYI
jgi:curved DNA-binding protein CbpA